MKGTVYLSTIDTLTAKNRIIGIALLSMVLFNLYNWFSLQQAKSEMKVALVPIAGGADMWIGNGKASPEYIRSISRYITGQIGNYQAATARRQLWELLPFFAPSKVSAATERFTKLADQIERYPSIASIMQWAGEDALKFNSEVIQVRARKDRLVNGKVVNSENVFYCIYYRINDTKFEILNLKERGGKDEVGENLCMVDERVGSTAAGK